MPVPRDDGSIFIGISSYRDPSCPITLRKAFSRADSPTLLSAGIVQHNCDYDCKAAEGWAHTRRIVSQSGPDVDCVTSFCESSLGKPHCEAGRVRILRLSEADSLGPFFTRYVGSQLYDGENFFLQIDSHTDFREGWDGALVKMLKRTPSYPNSVLSNYPPSGFASDPKPWPRRDLTDTEEERVTPLCKCEFEQCPGGNARWTIRLTAGQRPTPPKSDKPRDPFLPRRSLYIAAGFFITHGSFLEKVPFDPYLPFLFMGEEIALSIRLWTNGFDVYAPAFDVLSHEYGRHHSIKYWETIGIIFGSAGMHNVVTNLTIQRVQHLVGFPEAKRPEQVVPSSLLSRMAAYGVGSVRSADDFRTSHNLDVVKRTQKIPDWCFT